MRHPYMMAPRAIHHKQENDTFTESTLLHIFWRHTKLYILIHIPYTYFREMEKVWMTLTFSYSSLILTCRNFFLLDVLCAWKGEENMVDLVLHLLQVIHVCIQRKKAENVWVGWVNTVAREKKKWNRLRVTYRPAFFISLVPFSIPS